MFKRVRYVLLSLSLANLCFLSPWLVLLNPAHYAYYNWPEYPGFIEFIALGVAIVLLTLLFWVAANVVHKARSRSLLITSRLLLLLSLVLPLNSFLADYANISVFEFLQAHRWLMLPTLALSAVMVLVIFLFNRPLTRIATTLLIILSPLCLVNLVSAIKLRNAHISTEAFHDRHPATTVTTRLNTPHIVWIVFDEFDQNTAFVSRPPSLRLPEFDRFLSQSISAANAFPPNKFTEYSLPALITGQLVATGNAIAPNELVLINADGAQRKWSTENNVFSRARSEGFSTGTVGWFHPYCRVIGDSLDSCDWVPVVDAINPSLDKLSFGRAFWLCLRSALYRIPFAFRLLEWQYDRERKEQHRAEFERASCFADALLKQDLNLKFLHLPVPHHPWIFDARTHSFSSAAGNGYLDNLALADQTLGQVRRVLEDSGQWDSSIVLVSSDHWWRTSDVVEGKRDHRIPFMLKLAGQTVGIEYKTPFNTVLTDELVLQLLKGQLMSPTDVTTWIDSNSKLAENPLTAKEP